MAATRYIATIDAAFRREFAEHRLNRFLHVHLTLCTVAGLLPLFTPDAAARSASAWVLQAVLYCLSLSSLLLGLSAAQGDADEFPMLFTQPVGRATWLGGKAAALAALLIPASMLTITPAALTSGVTWSLVFVGLAAAGVCLVLALLGLAIGCWVRDHVRAAEVDERQRRRGEKRLPRRGHPHVRDRAAGGRRPHRGRTSSPPIRRAGRRATGRRCAATTR